MKIASIDVHVLRVALDAPYSAGGRQVDANWHVLAEVVTTDGVSGFGYIVALREALCRSVALATREIAATMIGARIDQPEANWARMAGFGDWVGPGGLAHYAICPLDIALWDAWGKTLGQPVFRLLGGARAELDAYASDGFWYSLSLDDLAAAARRAAGQGFRAVKLRVGNESDPAAVVARVEAVRQATNDAVGVMVDATGRWSAARAITTGRALAAAGVRWLEDPVAHTDLEAMARIRDQVGIPLASGEHLYTLDQFARTLRAGAVDIALLDLGRVGGVTPWRAIAALAHGFGVPVGGHVLPEIHVHLLCAAPNGHVVEYVPRSARLLRAMPALNGTRLAAPEAPGFGLDLDQAALARFRVPG
jgi:L-alanine-DL-glutamate epimerase-like enolase superfamily enzyme